MYKVSNHNFKMDMNSKGQLTCLKINNDKADMNWLIDQHYLDEHNYKDVDKLFGNFDIQVNNRTFNQNDSSLNIKATDDCLYVNYNFSHFSVNYIYSVAQDDYLYWTISISNFTDSLLKVDYFNLWIPLAYIMFRDKNVIRNIEHSTAVFTSLSDDFTKIAAIKRDNKGPHLGVFQTKGKTTSIGSYCRYTNLFREEVSPSLDGAIFHQLKLAEDRESNKDWLYDSMYEEELLIRANESTEWEFAFSALTDKKDFYEKGLSLGHPKIDYSPVVIKGHHFEATITLPNNEQHLKSVFLVNEKSGVIHREDVTEKIVTTGNQTYKLSLLVNDAGEQKLVVEFNNDKSDFVIFNVMEPIQTLIEARANYLCDKSYISEATDANAYGFKPISNQGESLGKLCFLLKKNLVANRNLNQVRKVEKSAVYYVKNKWFKAGDFFKPKKVHGEFYRTLDFDYIANVYFLLSQFKEEELAYHSPKTYLKWAADLLIFRFDEDMHESDREKEETEMNGIFNIYIKELITSLREEGLTEEYRRLIPLWEKFYLKIKENYQTYEAAITEHHYDNAGFGPTSESLFISGNLLEASHYGELILANIGFSNDFRNQNPDRWWEALSYMIHSLWGGLVSYSALVAYNHLKDNEYLKGSYRSMMAVLYCYDWNATASENRLNKGEAASTYSVPNPNLNKTSLSHNRFGQSVFLEDDAELFGGNATGDDWDMGEELVTYLSGFGTTTYIYMEDGELRCINGVVEKDGDQIIISSFAAYPKHYQFEGINLESIVANQNEIIPSITLVKNTEDLYEYEVNSVYE